MMLLRFPLPSCKRLLASPLSLMTTLTTVMPRDTAFLTRRSIVDCKEGNEMSYEIV